MTEALELKLKNTAACSRAAVSIDICTDTILSTAHNRIGNVRFERGRTASAKDEIS
jgi:hypothetical protein